MDYPIISTQWHYRESESLHLDDCPFCGESELAYIGRETPVGKRYSVNCFGCMTEMNPGYCQTKQQIHDLWNKRKEQTE
ncbi:MAG: hypothetical protein PHH03_09210 [Eubacteriales bacterium]|nr:hypothetical protein [Eubacteriales bacterium]